MDDQTVVAIDQIRDLVKRGIMLSPQNARVLINEIDQLREQLKLASQEHERTLDFLEEVADADYPPKRKKVKNHDHAAA